MKTESILGVISLILAVLFLATCAPAAAPAPAPQAPAPAGAPQIPAPAPAKAAVPVSPTTAAWQVEWDRVLAAAKSEGRVMLTTTAGGEVRAALMAGFQKAHGISLEVIVAPSGRAVPAIEAERRAGLYLRDVYIGGTGPMVQSLKPGGLLEALDSAFILPDLTDPELIKKTWFQGKLQWLDKDRTMLSALLYPGTPIAINTSLVKEGEIGSWSDLLNPKWKGKIAVFDPTISGTGGTLVLWIDQVLGWDWLQQLVKNEPVIMQDHYLMTDWLAHSKVAIAVAPSVQVILTFRQAGAPLKNITPKEGTWLGAGSGGLSMLNRAAHPNATKVFVNWVLSKEGQTVLAKSIGGQSVREDVPTDFLDPEQVRVPGFNYILNKEREDLLLAREAMTNKAKVIVAPLMKK